MFSIFDHLVSILIGTTLLLALVTVQQRGQQKAVEATVHHAAQAKGFALSAALQSDLENLYVVPADPPQTSEWSTVNLDWVEQGGAVTTLFTFHTLTDPTDPDAGLTAVAYRLEKSTTSPALKHRVARYLNNNVDDDGDGNLWDYAGGDAGGLLGFNSTLSNEVDAAEDSMGDEAGFSTVTLSFASSVKGPGQLTGDQQSTTKTNHVSQSLTLRPVMLSIDASTPLPPGTIPDSRLAIPYPAGWTAPRQTAPRSF